MEFAPPLVGCMISSGNSRFQLVRESGECVINLPTTALTRKVVGIGNASGISVHKFDRFSLTKGESKEVKTPLIWECHANFGCRRIADCPEKFSSFSKWTRMPRTISSGRGTPVAHVWRSLPPSSSPDRSGGESIPVFSPGSWQEGIPFLHGGEDVN
ncbi:MAG: flavin reductase family protein [Leptospirales bacterium]